MYRFQKNPLSCERFRKVAFFVIVFIVYCAAVSVTKKLHFQTKANTCGQGLIFSDIFKNRGFRSELTKFKISFKLALRSKK